MLQRNVQRTMDIVFQFMDIAAFLNSLFTWQYPLRSVIGLVVYVIIGKSTKVCKRLYTSPS